MSGIPGNPQRHFQWNEGMLGNAGGISILLASSAVAQTGTDDVVAAIEKMEASEFPAPASLKLI